MRNMKRWISLLLAASLLLALGACTAKPAVDPFADMTLTDILDKVYEKADVELPMLDTTEITEENEEYFLGTADLDYKEAVASEAKINAIAYSVCLVRMNDGADVKDAMQKIKDSVNPNKWICVGVEDKDVIVTNAGPVIALFMTELSGPLSESFTALAEGK